MTLTNKNGEGIDLTGSIEFSSPLRGGMMMEIDPVYLGTLLRIVNTAGIVDVLGIRG